MICMARRRPWPARDAAHPPLPPGHRHGDRLAAVLLDEAQGGFEPVLIGGVEDTLAAPVQPACGGVTRIGKFGSGTCLTQTQIFIEPERSFRLAAAPLRGRQSVRVPSLLAQLRFSRAATTMRYKRGQS